MMDVRETFLLFLIIGTLVTAGVTLYLRYYKKNNYSSKGVVGFFYDLSKETWLIFLVFAILHIFVFEKFIVPTGSMKPTLLEGDFVLVNKYHYSTYLPFINKELIKNNPIKRGDVIVFSANDNSGKTYIKRVVALPGDRIRYKNKTLYINDEPQTLEYISKAVDKFSGREIGVRLFKEKLGSMEHEIFLNYGLNSELLELVVPKGYYFMMGDNRDNSKDSRYFGVFAREKIVGKATMIFFSWDMDAYRIRFDRIGLKL